MAQQKFDKAFENLKKDVGNKTLYDFGIYLKNEYSEIDIESQIEKFKNIHIETKEKKKVGKTTNYHRFLRKKIEELKDSGDSKQENMREAQKAWKQLSDDEKKMYDKDDEISENDDSGKSENNENDSDDE